MRVQVAAVPTACAKWRLAGVWPKAGEAKTAGEEKAGKEEDATESGKESRAQVHRPLVFTLSLGKKQQQFGGQLDVGKYFQIVYLYRNNPALSILNLHVSIYWCF